MAYAVPYYLDLTEWRGYSKSSQHSVENCSVPNILSKMYFSLMHLEQLALSCLYNQFKIHYLWSH